MALAQPNRITAISQALPGSTVNRQFVNALYLALRGSVATDKEWARFEGQKVADVSNIVLGKTYSPFTGKTGGSTTTPTTTTKPALNLPDELKNNPYFAQLDADSQALIAYNWTLLQSQNQDKIATFQNALTEAAKQADPYWAEKINIIKDELGRTLGTYGADLESTQAELTRRRDYIQEQLQSGSTYITAEQQAELARQAQQYDVQIHNIGEEMANRGLTFSTINRRAREQAATQNEGVVEGINRTAEKQLSDLSAGSSFDLANVSAQLSDLQRRALEQRTSLVRGAEATVGSSALQDMGLGSLLMGGITGSLAEQKASDIFQRAQVLSATR